MFQTLPHFSSHLTSMIAQVGAIIAPPRHPTQWTKTLNEDSAKRSGTNTSKFPGWHGNLMEFGHLTLLTLDIYTILTKLHKSPILSPKCSQKLENSQQKCHHLQVIFGGGIPYRNLLCPGTAKKKVSISLRCAAGVRRTSDTAPGVQRVWVRSTRIKLRWAPTGYERSSNLKLWKVTTTIGGRIPWLWEEGNSNDWQGWLLQNWSVHQCVFSCWVSLNCFFLVSPSLCYWFLSRSLEMFHDRLVCAKATHDVGEITGNISEATGWCALQFC